MDDSSTEQHSHDRQQATEQHRDDVDNLEQARLLRLRALHAMTMSERLTRAHALCAQLSKMRPIQPSSR